MMSAVLTGTETSSNIAFQKLDDEYSDLSHIIEMLCFNHELFLEFLQHFCIHTYRRTQLLGLFVPSRLINWAELMSCITVAAQPEGSGFKPGSMFSLGLPEFPPGTPVSSYTPKTCIQVRLV